MNGRPSETPTQWRQVFKPGSFPTYNYVIRHALVDSIKNFVEYGGKHILAVTGLSGTGKTVLVKDVIQNKLSASQEHISPDHWKLLVLESVWFNNSKEDFRKQLCSALELLPTQQEKKREVSFLGKFFGFSAGNVEITTDEVDEQDILRALHHKVVVIDDFHRLSYPAQVAILSYIRGLTNQLIRSDSTTDFRFVIIYIPYKLTNISLIDNELSPRRVEHLSIPLWSERELEDIVRVTFRQNDFCLTNAGALAKYAYGLPALMQQFCLDYCLEYHANDRPNTIIPVKDKQVPPVMTKFADLNWESYGSDEFYASITAVNSGSFPDRSQLIRSRLDQRAGNIYQMIWYVLSLTDNDDSNLKSLVSSGSSFEIPLSTLQDRLRQFTDMSPEIIEDIGRYVEKISEHTNQRYQDKLNQLREDEDFSQQRTTFLDPLFEYKSDSFGVNSRLVINNPEFLFTLALAQAHRRKFSR